MSEYGAPATADRKDHHLRWPNFAALRHEQARKADPIEVPDGYPEDAPIPVAEGARFAPPRPDRPRPGLPTTVAAEGKGLQITGSDKPVGTGTEGSAAEAKPVAGGKPGGEKAPGNS